MNHPSEIRFLEGPQGRVSEFKFAWKVFNEFIRGFRSLAFIGPCVTIFGSARYGEGHPYYEITRKVGAEVAKMGFTVLTGGGPGLMEAANRGAKEGGGTSLGCNIILPFEQKLNPYVDIKVEFEFFFTRKVILRKNSVAYILMPGGFGTMDEIFEVITLIQTGKLPPRPIVCMGTEYWKHLGVFLRETMLGLQTISPEDLDLYFVTDDTDEAIAYIQKKLSHHETGAAESADVY